jgi:hypothetical protein
MTTTSELDALAQAIADAETRAGRAITEDEALAVARAMRLIGAGWIGDGTQGGSVKYALTPAHLIEATRAAYAAGKASADARVAELESAFDLFLNSAIEHQLQLAHAVADDCNENGVLAADDLLEAIIVARATLKGNANDE